VRYDKGGSETRFGLFGLGDYIIMNLSAWERWYPVYCLTPQDDPAGKEDVASSLARVFGGSGLDFLELCRPDPAKVVLGPQGFREIKDLNDTAKMAIFLHRVVEHMGGEVVQHESLISLAKRAEDYSSVVQELWGQKPSWAAWDDNAACVADKEANEDRINDMVDALCNFSSVDCESIPPLCDGEGMKMRRADYVLSAHFKTAMDFFDRRSKGGRSSKVFNPAEGCNFGGLAKFSRQTLYSMNDHACVVNKDPYTTPLTEIGYRLIIEQGDASKTQVFLRRLLQQAFETGGMNEQQLLQYAHSPEESLPSHRVVELLAHNSMPRK